MNYVKCEETVLEAIAAKRKLFHEANFEISSIETSVSIVRKIAIVDKILNFHLVKWKFHVIPSDEITLSALILGVLSG